MYIYSCISVHVYLFNTHTQKRHNPPTSQKSVMFPPNRLQPKNKNEPHHGNHLFNIYTQNWHDSLTSKLESMSSARSPVFLFVCVVARQFLRTCVCYVCLIMCARYICVIMCMRVYTSMWKNVFCLELCNIFARLHLTYLCVYLLVYMWNILSWL